MIFISHKSDPDHAYAMKLKEVLAANDIEGWLAPEDISVGQNFAQEIPKAIKSCESFLLLLTNCSQHSAHVTKEVNFAIKHNKKIVPVCIKSEKLELIDEYDYLLQNVQIKTVDFENEDFEELLDELKSDAQIYNIEIGNHKDFTMIKGDYQENMKYLIDNRMIDLDKTVFAIGIDGSSRLDLSSNKGILRYVCEFLQEEYNVSLDFLQSAVDNAKMSQLKHKNTNQNMQYGDSVFIKVPISQNQNIQLLLISNSNKRKSFSTSNDLDDVEGIDSRIIILRIFNRCAELGEAASNLVIGAMGTNGLSFPYEVITAEILNAYVYSVRQQIYPHNLFYSVRLIDMENANVKPEKIYKYIRNLIQFL